jgi:hypothetical protein
MAGYTRTDTTNNIATGNVINASDLDNEYDAIQAAYNATTGHTHGGAAGEGAPITRVGPVQDVVVSGTAVTPKTDNTMDLGSPSLEFKDAYIDGTAYIDTLELNGTVVTATAAELNFVDGVTSNVQTQLDNKQPLDAQLTDIAALTPTDNGIIIGNGTNFVLESGATARASLGLAIGTDVQAYDADLAAFALKTAPTGAVVGTTDTQTLTNKTVALGSNTVSGTLAQFNTAVTDADLASIAGAETLTNKTISADNNTLSGIAASSFVLSNASGNIDGAAAQKAIPAGVVVGTTDTQTLTNKTVALGSNTVTGTLAQFNTAVTDADFASIAGTETLTNKTIDGASNTLTNLPLANITEPVRHSVRPSLLLDFANTKTLDPRITFTRASTGTYYDGKTVAKAEENLLIRSQQFDFFATGNTTVISNSTAAPDGTTTADTVTETASTSGHEIYQSFTSTTGLPYTWSVFVKANGRTKVRFRCQATAVIYDVNYDLTAVTATGAGGTGTATITDAGNGWYRITATTTSTASGTGYWQFNLLDDSSNISYTGDGTSGVFLWGAQLEQRSSVTAYTATTTAPITNYIPALQSAASGVARFEHNPVTGESLGLEIEEQRTNLVQRSEEFDNAYWRKDSSAILSNQVIAPDGTLTADKLYDDAVGVVATIYNDTALTLTAQAYTWSVFAKAGELNWIAISAYDGTARRTWFNLATGAVGTNAAGNTATITPVGNGWYRCTVSRTAAATSAGYWQINLANADNIVTTPANAYSGVYIWGAQLEAGAFATSYIPTVASQVTRSADAASMTGTNFSSWYRADEGTVYVDAVPASVAANRSSLEITDSSGNQNNVIDVFAQRTADNLLAYVAVNNASQVSITQSNANGKTVFAYKVNDFSATRNGATIGNDTSGLIPQGMTRAFIGDDYNGGNSINGTIKKLAYYPARLTNAELVGLSTV